MNGKRAKALRRAYREEFGGDPAPAVRVKGLIRRRGILGLLGVFLRRLFRIAPDRRVLSRRSEWRLLKACYRRAQRKEA